MGIYQSVTQYDGNENYTRTYYNEDNNPCYSLMGIYKAVIKSDSTRYSETFYDLDGKLAYHIECNYAKIEIEYDKNRNVEKKAYYDIDNELCINEDGYTEEKIYSTWKIKYKYALAEYKYDSFSNLIEASYYGVGMKPYIFYQVKSRSGFLSNSISTFGGYSKYKCKYDKSGNLIEESYWGIDGKLCLYNQTFFTSNWLGKDDKEYRSGYAIIKHEYDSNNYLTKTSYFGTDGKPCSYYEYKEKDDLTLLCSFGYAEIRYEYNSNGEKIKESYYDTKGKPYACFFQEDGFDIRTYGGYAEVRHEYNSLGDLIRSTYYDVTGKLNNFILPLGGLETYAVEKWIYSSSGKFLEVLKYDAEGNLIKS
jgi:hypothetical protein